MRLSASISRANPVNLPSFGAVQRTDPSKSEVTALANNSWMNRGRLTVAGQGNFLLFQYPAVPHQLACDYERLLFQVADGHSRADPSHLVSSREDRVLDSLAGTDPRDSDLGVVESQESTEAATGDDFYRPGHQRPSSWVEIVSSPSPAVYDRMVKAPSTRT